MRALMLFPAFVLAAGGDAFAQAPRDTTVAIAPWWAVVEPFIMPLVSAIVAGLLAWLSTEVKRFLGIKIEAQHREALHSAVMSGVAAALTRMSKSAQDARIEIKADVVRDAILWAERSVPDAIKALGVTPEDIANLAAAKLSILAEAPSAIPTKPPGA